MKATKKTAKPETKNDRIVVKKKSKDELLKSLSEATSAKGKVKAIKEQHEPTKQELAEARRANIKALLAKHPNMSAQDLVNKTTLPMTLVVGALSVLFKRGEISATKIKGKFHYSLAA